MPSGHRLPWFVDTTAAEYVMIWVLLAMGAGLARDTQAEQAGNGIAPYLSIALPPSTWAFILFFLAITHAASIWAYIRWARQFCCLAEAGIWWYLFGLWAISGAHFAESSEYFGLGIASLWILFRGPGS